jgi:hypothetical protein
MSAFRAGSLEPTRAGLRDCRVAPCSRCEPMGPADTAAFALNDERAVSKNATWPVPYSPGGPSKKPGYRVLWLSRSYDHPSPHFGGRSAVRRGERPIWRSCTTPIRCRTETESAYSALPWSFLIAFNTKGPPPGVASRGRDDAQTHSTARDRPLVYLFSSLSAGARAGGPLPTAPEKRHGESPTVRRAPYPPHHQGPSGHVWASLEPLRGIPPGNGRACLGEACMRALWKTHKRPPMNSS